MKQLTGTVRLNLLENLKSTITNVSMNECLGERMKDK